MRIYLAARYSRREELCGYREQLQALGHEVTAVWLNGKHQISDDGVPLGDEGERLVEGDDGSNGDQAAALRSRFALEDFRDVQMCDLLIAFTEPPRSSASRGGRHVELGLALGMMKCVAVVGYRENIFCWLEDVNFFPSWEECRSWLAARLAFQQDYMVGSGASSRTSAGGARVIAERLRDTMTPMCPHCGQTFSVLVNYHLIPEHSFGGKRCPGTLQIPRNKESDRRPLWKDQGGEE